MEGEGFFDGAIRRAVEAGDFERAGMLIARHWYGYVFSGQTATVERWLSSLPEGTIDGDAGLCLIVAWLCALVGRREESARYLALTESIPYEGPLPDGTASVEFGAAVLRASFGYGGVRSALQDARSAMELEPNERSPLAAFVRFALETGLYLSRDARRPESRSKRPSTWRWRPTYPCCESS